MVARKTKAFTLIEILMALMVLAVGLASVLAVFVAGVRSSKKVVDESAAALSASAVLARILAEDKELPLNERDYLAKIEKAREEGRAFLWINPSGENMADPVGADLGDQSLYCWRARASRFRGELKDPMKDTTVPLKGTKTNPIRVSPEQYDNPDSDELWRITVQIYRVINADPEGRMPVTAETQPIDTYQTYVCTAHR